MTGYCSTRDGRARGIAAPRSPHVIWTTQIPYDDDISSIDRATTIVTDDASHAYVGSFVTIGGTAPVFNKVDTKTGAIEFPAPAAESKNGLALLLTSAREVEVFNADPSMSVASFQPTSPVPDVDPEPIAFDPINLLDPVIGSDGGLYFVYATAEGNDSGVSIHVSRSAQDGVLAWTSLDLISLGPAPQSPAIDNAYPVGIALESDDQVVVALSVDTGSATTVMVGLDPKSGTVRWTSSFSGQASPPVIAIGIVAAGGDHVVTSTLHFLDRTGTLTFTANVVDAARLLGVTTDDKFLLATSDTVSKLDEQGNTAWIQNVQADDAATIASNGIVIVKNAVQIVGLDLSTGAILWKLVPPSSQCISSGTLALTSDGAVMALQCDGTLFAAAD